MARFDDVVRSVGETPLVRLNRLPTKTKTTVLVKLESRNPLGSVKDRIAGAMIEAAEREGELRPGAMLIEPTSGNTGIGLAFVAAVKGYRLRLTMPESMSEERRRLLSALGAELVPTPAEEGMTGAIRRAEALLNETPGARMLRQFSNPANPEAHRRTTAEEIWRDTGGRVDAFVAGIGTGGTFTGVTSVLKARRSALRAVAVEPAESPVLSGGEAGPHRIQGIGAGFVPENLDVGLIDEVLTIDSDRAEETARRMAREEGILCGVSSGANVAAALALAARPESAGKTILTIVCDTGERYLSSALFG